MRVGVKILDEAEFRRILDEGFGRLGYQLANSDVDEQLYLTHYCHLTPRGRGTAYLLKFTKRPDGDWDMATLLDAATNEPLASRRLEVDFANHYRQWADRIIEMCAHLSEAS